MLRLYEENVNKLFLILESLKYLIPILCAQGCTDDYRKILQELHESFYDNFLSMIKKPLKNFMNY